MAAWTSVEEDVCLCSRGVPANRVNFADLGTCLYTNSKQNLDGTNETTLKNTVMCRSLERSLLALNS